MSNKNEKICKWFEDIANCHNPNTNYLYCRGKDNCSSYTPPEEPQIKGVKAAIPICALHGCNRVALLRVSVRDTVSLPEWVSTPEMFSFCCKTHMLRYLQSIKMPRYSNKRVQRLGGTMLLTEQRETPKS